MALLLAAQRFKKRGGSIQSVRLFAEGVQQTRDFFVQFIVSIGIGSGAGNHHDLRVQAVEFINGVVDHPHHLDIRAEAHFHEQFVFSRGQIHGAGSAVFVYDGFQVPIHPIGKRNVFVGLTRDRTVDIDVAEGGHADGLSLAEFESYVI